MGGHEDGRRPAGGPEAGDVEGVDKILLMTTDVRPARGEAPGPAGPPLPRDGRRARSGWSCRSSSSARRSGRRRSASETFYDLDVVGEIVKGERLVDNFRYRFDFPTTSTSNGPFVPLKIERELFPGEYRSEGEGRRREPQRGRPHRREGRRPRRRRTCRSRPRRRRPARPARPPSRGSSPRPERRRGRSSSSRSRASSRPASSGSRRAPRSDDIAFAEFFLDNREDRHRSGGRRSTSTSTSASSRAAARREGRRALEGREGARRGRDDPERGARGVPGEDHRPGEGGEARRGRSASSPTSPFPRRRSSRRSSSSSTRRARPSSTSRPSSRSSTSRSRRTSASSASWRRSRTGRRRRTSATTTRRSTSPRCDVQAVELYTSVLAKGRPVTGLAKDELPRSSRTACPQALDGFEVVTNLPLSLGIGVDTSGSMEEIAPRGAEGGERLPQGRHDAAGPLLPRHLRQRAAARLPLHDRPRPPRAGARGPAGAGLDGALGRRRLRPLPVPGTSGAGRPTSS